MRKFHSTGIAGSLAAAGIVLLAGSLVHAQQLRQFVPFRDSPLLVVQAVGEDAAAIEVSDYWIGVLCGPVGPAVKAHLKLDHGLAVERVVPDTPAAKAGIEPHDILLSFGDRPLNTVVDLVEAVKAAEDQKAELKLIHAGKEKTLEIAAAKRPEGDVQLQHSATPQEALKKWMDQALPGGAADVPLRWQRLRPGILLPENAEGERELPEGVAVTITKNGKEPAQITIKKDGKTYTATEDKLDELPDDVRKLAHRWLGQRPAFPFNFNGQPWTPGDIAKQWPQLKKQMQSAPPQIRVYPGKPKAQMLQAERQMRQQLDQIRRSLDELQKQFDDFHGQKPNEPDADAGDPTENVPAEPNE